MEYNLKYTKIKPSVINAVRETILEHKFFKQNQTTKFVLLVNLKDKLSELYNIDYDNKPTLIIVNNTDGYYNPIENVIALNNKLSLITFLHEFKHFLQIIQHKPNSENIARSYSLSLFYQASPRHFKRALEKGLILHQKP